MSIAVLEALAAGTPVVSTPGQRDARARTACGSRASIPTTWRTAVRELLQDPVLRTKMGAAGEKLVRERFSADAMVDSYVREYLSLAPTIND